MRRPGPCVGNAAKAFRVSMPNWLRWMVGDEIDALQAHRGRVMQPMALIGAVVAAIA